MTIKELEKALIAEIESAEKHIEETRKMYEGNKNQEAFVMNAVGYRHGLIIALKMLTGENI